MNKNKASPQEILEVLEQQKKLQDLRTKIVGVLEKVNQTINALTVENLELTSSQIEKLEYLKEPAEQKPVIIYQDPVEHEKRAKEINQQIIDLELDLAQYDVESDSDESEF